MHINIWVQCDACVCLWIIAPKMLRISTKYLTVPPNFYSVFKRNTLSQLLIAHFCNVNNRIEDFGTKCQCYYGRPKSNPTFNAFSMHAGDKTDFALPLCLCLHAWTCYNKFQSQRPKQFPHFKSQTNKNQVLSFQDMLD